MNTQTSDDKNIALLTHLSGLLFSIIVPLIIWLTNKDKPEKSYLTEEGKEALNFQITVLIAYFVAGVLSVVAIGLLLMPLIWLGNLVFCILAAIKVSNGQSYRYPLTLRLIK
ncbi:hypothetical protein A7A76_15000 [Lysobacter enzymogenes]|uniref:DUF4870 domain-containing protein n=1 Tax=Lysobacter enzymogenes TaxID=69 RepID=UPI0019D1D116|nr:DUF4870 domain-containing protein [Lysobacter enzymogenes]MBN7136023.1 hypothetical protein [Lysobacter enzymogenes]